jgi:hypothetical protein
MIKIINNRIFKTKILINHNLLIRNLKIAILKNPQNMMRKRNMMKSQFHQIQNYLQ